MILHSEVRVQHERHRLTAEARWAGAVVMLLVLGLISLSALLPHLS